MVRKSTNGLPEWSRKILAFRQALKLTQGELGKRLRDIRYGRFPVGAGRQLNLLQTHTYGLGISPMIRSAGSFGNAQVLALRT